MTRSPGVWVGIVCVLVLTARLGRAQLVSSTGAVVAPVLESLPPKTYITGTRMNILRKGEAVEFVGGVNLTRGNDFLSGGAFTARQRNGQ